jgi:hypothetical protein
MKVLVKLFQKLVGWKGEALLALRRARNILGVFFLITWQSLAIAAELAEPVFICAFGVKEKSG